MDYLKSNVHAGSHSFQAERKFVDTAHMLFINDKIKNKKDIETGLFYAKNLGSKGHAVCLKRVKQALDSKNLSYNILTKTSSIRNPYTVLLSDQFIIDVVKESYNSDAYVNVTCEGPLTVNELINYESDFYVTKIIKDPEPHMSALVIDSGGKLGARKLKNSAIKLEEGNYSEDVLAAYDILLTDLKDPHPPGRLTIIEGPPGTGKTFLLKNLPVVVKNSLFLVIPPALVQKIGHPDVIGSFLDISSELEDDIVVADDSEEKKIKMDSITLILEDADECLLHRTGANSSLVSSLLNTSSGILGDTLNLRVIATTNLDKVKMDDALLRPGRLSCHFVVDEVSPSKAKEIYKRITGGDEYSRSDGLTLADIYAKANKAARAKISLKKEKKRIGF